jgi:hypothetical protein
MRLGKKTKCFFDWFAPPNRHHTTTVKTVGVMTKVVYKRFPAPAPAPQPAAAREEAPEPSAPATPEHPFPDPARFRSDPTPLQPPLALGFEEEEFTGNDEKDLIGPLVRNKKGVECTGPNKGAENIVIEGLTTNAYGQINNVKTVHACAAICYKYRNKGCTHFITESVAEKKSCFLRKNVKPEKCHENTPWDTYELRLPHSNGDIPACKIDDEAGAAASTPAGVSPFGEIDDEAGAAVSTPAGEPLTDEAGAVVSAATDGVGEEFSFSADTPTSGNLHHQQPAAEEEDAKATAVRPPSPEMPEPERTAFPEWSLERELAATPEPEERELAARVILNARKLSATPEPAVDPAPAGM